MYVRSLYCTSTSVFVELGNIVYHDIKCHNNRYQREFFSIVISAVQYYRQYCDYHKAFYSVTSRFVYTSYCIHNFDAYSTVSVTYVAQL